MTLYWYPKCSTCQRAKAWLDGQGIRVETWDLKAQPPAQETLEAL